MSRYSKSPEKQPKPSKAAQALKKLVYRRS